MSAPFSRRTFLSQASLGALMVGCNPQPVASTPTVAPAPLAIDMHNHVYPAGTEPHPQHGPGGGGPRDGGAPHDPEPEVTLALGDALQRSGLTAVCAAFVLDFAANKAPGDARTNFLHWLDAIDAQLSSAGIERALTAGDLRAAQASRRPTVVQSVEGAMFVEGHVERVNEVYARGLRHLQLLHERDDLVKPLGDVNTQPGHLGGLTTMGANVVKTCNRLGILVDLAHASHGTVLGALRVATKPLVVSHTSLDGRPGADPRMAQMMKPRLITAEHAKVVADAGGIVGVWTHMANSLGEFVESIKAMADAIGIDHVGMGTDTDLLAGRPGKGTVSPWPSFTGNLVQALLAEMQKQGFTGEDAAKVVGGNFLRVFERATARG